MRVEVDLLWDTNTNWKSSHMCIEMGLRVSFHASGDEMICLETCVTTA